MFFNPLKKGHAFLLPILVSIILCPTFAMDSFESEVELTLNYKQHLPTIHHTKDQTRDICDFLLSFKQDLPSFQEKSLYDKISDQITHGRPLELLLVGFPSKSTNTETKVLSETVDLGDYLALVTLDHMIQQIQQVYEPGARMTIISDGVLYSEALRMPEDQPQQYGEQLRRLTQNLGGCVRVLTLQDFSGPLAQSSPHQQRAYLLDQPFVCPPEDESTLKGKRIFAEAEFKCTLWNDYFTNQTLDKLQLSCEPTAKKAIQHFNTIRNGYRKHQVTMILQAISESSQQFGLYVSKFYPNYSDVIRLSVHDHGDVSHKLGINLVYGTKGTPWHKTPLVTSEGVKLIYRKELPKGSTLKSMTISGIPLSYYEKL